MLRAQCQSRKLQRYPCSMWGLKRRVGCASSIGKTTAHGACPGETTSQLLTDALPPVAEGGVACARRTAMMPRDALVRSRHLKRSANGLHAKTWFASHGKCNSRWHVDLAGVLDVEQGA